MCRRPRSLAPFLPPPWCLCCTAPRPAPGPPGGRRCCPRLLVRYALSFLGQHHAKPIGVVYHRGWCAVKPVLLFTFYLWELNTIKLKLQPDTFAAVGIVSGMVLQGHDESGRARARYRDPRTTFKQREARAAFYTADLFWQNLPPDHKNLWRAWRKWDPLHGYPLCMRCNIPLARAHQPLLHTPPKIPPWHYP